MDDAQRRRINRLRRRRRLFMKFMSSFHGLENVYPIDYTFQASELRTITPEDIITFIEQRKKFHKSVTALEDYRAAINSFMPDQKTKWDPVTKRGNPAKSDALRKYFKRLRGSENEVGFVSWEHPQLTSPTGSEVMFRRLAQKMQSQNDQFMKICESLNQTIDHVKNVLNENNAILNEMMSFNADTTKPIGVVVSGGNNNGHVVRREWWHKHDDGIERRVPPSWTVPKCNLRTLYYLWHCGDNVTCPMKYFTSDDISFVGRRAKAYLCEIKALVKELDDEATRSGLSPQKIITPLDATPCFDAGVKGIKVNQTPFGRSREIEKLSWQTVLKYKEKARKNKRGKKGKIPIDSTPEKPPAKKLKLSAGDDENDTTKNEL